MQNNDLIGKVVLSTAGRDSGNVYVILKLISNDYVYIVNGNTKTIKEPKKKKLKHLKILENSNSEITLAISNNEKSADLKIKRFLKVKGIVKEG
ncbi:MAG: hypothetical protein ACRC2K_04490 [Clostridium sp.]